jgi:dienelactone hydrolase
MIVFPRKSLFECNTNKAEFCSERVLHQSRITSNNHEMTIIIFLLLFCISVVVFLLPYGLISANPFPTPSGQYKVGTSNFIWNLPSHSGIIAKIWYPSSTKQDVHSPYIDYLGRTLSVMTTGLNPLSKLLLNRRYLGRIQAPSATNTALAQSQDGFPVILLSPGFGGVNFLNTFYALEFASHGFIVIGINHPGWSSGSLLVDGSQVALNQVDFTDVDRADTLFSEIVEQKANNLSAVLDELLHLNTTPDSWLYQRIDPTRIFAAGHSSGGSASFLACGKDSRIVKSVNLDGFLYMDKIDVADMEKEFLLILSNRDKYAPQVNKQPSSFDVVMAKDKTRIDQFSCHINVHVNSLDSANHLNFMDLPLILNPAFSKRIGLFGEVDRLDLLLKTSATMIGFFDDIN